jgi:hypothetical protein
MTRFDDRLAGLAPEAQRLQSLANALREASPTELQNELDRLARLGARAGAIIDSADGEFVSQTMLDELSSALAGAANSLQIFQDTGDETQRQSAIDHGDAIVNALRTWPSPPVKSDVSDLRAQTKAARSDVRQVKKEAQRAADEIRANVDAQQAQLADEVASSGAELTNRVAESRSALEAAISGIDQQITDRRTEVEETVARLEQEFREAQGRQTDEFRSTFDGKVKGFDEQRAASETEAETLLQELEGLRTKAAELVGIVGIRGTTRGYQDRANAEQSQANQWRWFAIAFGIAAVAVLLWAALRGRNETFEASQFAAKVGLSAALGGLATYSARESGKHRRSGADARRRELALQALPAYLEPLETERRNALLEGLAVVYFGPELPTGGNSTDEGGGEVVGSVATVQRMLFDLLRGSITR